MYSNISFFYKNKLRNYFYFTPIIKKIKALIRIFLLNACSVTIDVRQNIKKEE